MISNKLTTTVQTPSHFALPTCGHAFSAILRGTDLGAYAGAATTVTRERIATQFKGGMGFVPANAWGTTAWSPPTS